MKSIVSKINRNHLSPVIGVKKVMLNRLVSVMGCYFPPSNHKEIYVYFSRVINQVAHFLLYTVPEIEKGNSNLMEKIYLPLLQDDFKVVLESACLFDDSKRIVI